MNCVRMMMLSLLLGIAVLAGPCCLTVSAGDGIIRQGVLVPYEITTPDGWIYSTGSRQYVLGVIHPEGDDPYPYISLTVLGGAFQQDVTPEALVERNLYERPGAVLVSSEWVNREDGSFLLAEFTWSSELGEIRAIKAFHRLEQEVLVVTAAALSADYAEVEQLFHDAVMSVRVKEHPGKAARKKAAAESDDHPPLHW